MKLKKIIKLSKRRRGEGFFLNPLNPSPISVIISSFDSLTNAHHFQTSLTPDHSLSRAVDLTEEQKAVRSSLFARHY